MCLLLCLSYKILKKKSKKIRVVLSNKKNFLIISITSFAQQGQECYIFFCIAPILKQTSVSFEEHCQNFTCYCFKCRIHRLLGRTLLLRGFKNVYYFSNSNVNLVILTC